MRTLIWKALKWRSKAICVAIEKYNKLAVHMTPPVPTLDWKNIVNYTFVSEFEILQHSYSHADIASHPWISPANQEIASCYFKVLRACEELHRLNIEIRHLHTAIYDEQYHLYKCAESLAETDLAQAAEIQEILQICAQVNQHNLAQLRAIFQMPGFTGSTERGVRATETSEAPSAAPADAVLHGLDDSTIAGGDEDTTQLADADGELNDDAQEDLRQMGQFVEDLVVGPDEDEDIPRSKHGMPLSMMSTIKF